MAVTVVQLAAAMRLGDGVADVAEPLASILSRFLGVSEAWISIEAEDAPDAVKDEATIRFSSYLYDAPVAPGQGYANAWRNSGAAALVSRWHEVRAVVGGVRARENA